MHANNTASISLISATDVHCVSQRLSVKYDFSVTRSPDNHEELGFHAFKPIMTNTDC